MRRPVVWQPSTMRLMVQRIRTIGEYTGSRQASTPMEKEPDHLTPRHMTSGPPLPQPPHQGWWEEDGADIGHPSHRVWVIGDVAACLRCAAYISLERRRLYKLAHACAGGPANPTATLRLSRLREGKHPVGGQFIAQPQPRLHSSTHEGSHLEAQRPPQHQGEQPLRQQPPDPHQIAHFPPPLEQPQAVSQATPSHPHHWSPPHLDDHQPLGQQRPVTDTHHHLPTRQHLAPRGNTQAPPPTPGGTQRGETSAKPQNDGCEWVRVTERPRKL